MMQHTILATGQRVQTEWAPGTVQESSARRAHIALDDGQTINVCTGTPGYRRLQPIPPHPPTL